MSDFVISNRESYPGALSKVYGGGWLFEVSNSEHKE